MTKTSVSVLETIASGVQGAGLKAGVDGEGLRDSLRLALEVDPLGFTALFESLPTYVPKGSSVEVR